MTARVNIPHHREDVGVRKNKHSMLLINAAPGALDDLREPGVRDPVIVGE